MHEIERKYALLLPAAEIERRAAADGSLRRRILIRQRYLRQTREWRLRAKEIRTPSGPVRSLTLKRARDGEVLRFPLDGEAWTRLLTVCRTRRVREGDAPGTVRLALDDLSNWTVRIRRSSDPSGARPCTELTLKRGITMRRCVEIETATDEASHAAAVPHCGPALAKRRVKVAHGGLTWEIDSFSNPELAGIEYAEVELPDESTEVRLPSWAGADLSDDPSLKNARLVRRIGA